MKFLFANLLALALLAAPTTRAIAGDATAGEDFFENKIRPLLVDHCYECHSAEKQVKGGLRLDHRAGWERGGDSGPAIVRGSPDESLVIRAVRYLDKDLQMPPKDKKLAVEQIALLEEWVAMGAPDPRNGEAVVVPPGSDHWAFQAVSNPPLPAVMNRRWPRNDLDAFVLAAQEQRNLAPSPRADARTLIRRVFYDLTGLPPTPDEVARFEADPSPEAYARIVDDLLSRPAFGERWARHWLDVARYADTKGYVFEEERKYAFAYTYRDYVVQAFNDDKPIDRFLIEQIAADHLELGDDKRPLAAMGYLTLGRRFLNNQHDIIDDRIDVVTRGMMGLTVACARCHDHKYDPIPAADYYSLYGVFASSHEPGEKPLLGVEPPQYAAYLEEKNKRVTARDGFIAETNEAIRRKLNANVGTYLLAAHDAAGLDGNERESLAKKRSLDNNVLGRWLEANETWQKESNAVFLAWNRLRVGVTNSEADLTDRMTTVLAELPDRLQPAVAAALTEARPRTLADVAGVYDKLFAAVDQQWQLALRAGGDLPPDRLQDDSSEQLRQILFVKGSPTDLDDGELRRIYDVPQSQKARQLQRQVEELEATHPGAPPRAMVLFDNASPTEPHIFKRGQPGMKGDQVPRRFLELLTAGERKPFARGSGRLELAQSIASTDNPLTSRVFVNRVWAQFFDRPLVGTPSDFGVRSDPPTHPELLDHLAWRFMHEDGWSMKQLQRRIVLSATYQQASVDVPRNRQIDPGNAYLWRQNRKRLDFEGMRDGLLAISGNLDRTIGGQAVKIDGHDFAPRRTLYGFIDRQNLPGMFRTFDLASPDTTSPQRFNTTVPQQALFLMNSPFIARQARELVGRLGTNRERHSEYAVRELYRLVLQREPDPGELEVAREFLENELARPLPKPPEPDWQYGFGALDETTGRLTSFTPLSHFADDRWSVSAKVPDPDAGWVLLTREGGHPGNDLAHAVVRRWKAPAAGQVTVRGRLKHGQEAGDGVRARVLAAGEPVTGEFIVHNTETTTELKPFPVRAGYDVDLVVDCRSGPDSDSFEWRATIRYERDPGETDSAPRGEWNTARLFSGPIEQYEPLTAWERYAQVLLVSNEVFFVD